MASVKVANTPQVGRAQTTGLRRCKSHEPGQRVMTEAIAFLFAYYASQYTPKDPSFIAPSVEEFFSYVRNLSLKTYHKLIPGPRRKVSNRLLGVSEKTSGFETLLNFLDFIDSRRPGDELISSLLQAQNIGLQALIVYNSFIEEDGDSSLKTHIAEPFVWYAGILYHDLIQFREHGLGIALRFIQDGVVHLEKNKSKKRISYFFETCAKYMERATPFLDAFDKYLQSLFP